MKWVAVLFLAPWIVLADGNYPPGPPPLPPQTLRKPPPPWELKSEIPWVIEDKLGVKIPNQPIDPLESSDTARPKDAARVELSRDADIVVEYPPRIPLDVYRMAVANLGVHATNPGLLPKWQAILALLRLGEPAMAAIQQFAGDARIRDVVEIVKKEMAPLELRPPALGKGLDRLAREDLVRAFPFERNGAFAARIRLLDAEVLPAVIQATGDPHAFLRHNATWFLGVFDRPEAMETLLRLAQSRDAVCRVRAIDALVVRREPKLAPILADTLKSDAPGYFKFLALEGLGLIGGADATSHVAAFLGKTPDEELRWAAIMALGRMGGTEASALLSFKTGLLGQAALIARTRLGDASAKQQIIDLLKRGLDHRDAFREFRAPNLRALLECGADADVRAQLKAGLLASKEGMAFTLDALEAIAARDRDSEFFKEFTDLNQHEPLVCEAALWHLARCDATAAEEVAEMWLRRYKGQSSADEMRRLYAAALGVLGKKADAKQVVDMVIAERQLAIRSRSELFEPALAACRRLRVSEVVKVHEDVLDGGLSSELRAKALLQLVEAIQKEAAPLLIRALSDRSRFVQRCADACLRRWSEKAPMIDWLEDSESDRNRVRKFWQEWNAQQ